jgi:hypothetical protein
MKKEYNSSNEQDVSSAKANDKNKRKTEQGDLRQLLSTKWGRRMVWRILERTGQHRTSFTGNSTTFFNEGQRNIGLWLVDEVLSADTNQYLTMIKENNNNGEQNA